MCSKHGIKLPFLINEHGLKFCLESYLTYEETAEVPFDDQIFQYFGSAKLEINVATRIPTSKLCLLKNVADLEIIFHRSTLSVELLFITRLQQIKKLTLVLITTDAAAAAVNNGNNDPAIICPGQVFECGFQRTHSLHVKGDIFGPDAAQIISSLYLYFPNLVKLKLENLQHVPVNIFINLSLLKCLEEMKIVDSNFTDEMFIQPFKSQQLCFVCPAIQAFNNLQVLHISNCPNLTDVCFVDGIVLNPTLREVLVDGINIQQLTCKSLAAFKSNNFVKCENRYLFIRQVV